MLACMLVYPMGIQIYDQASNLRSWSKPKLHHVVLLGFGLKVSKITLNIMKVGVYSYLPNAHLNLWSNFNSKKLVKSETLLYGFAEVGIKGLKYFGTSQNFVCTLVYQMGIQIYDQISIIRNYSKMQLCQAFSLALGLKVVKTDWNVAKVGMHACLSDGHPKVWSSFIS